MLAPLQVDLLREGLLAGVLAVLSCSVVGTWVVIRGLGFMGDALAHAVLPGIAVATLIGVSPVLGALASAAVTVAGIELASRRGGVGQDTGIGLLFVGMLALGVVIISRSDTFATDLNTYLFGDVLGVRPSDLWTEAAAAVVAIVATVVLYRPFLALSFNPDKAASLGMRPRLASAVLLSLLAVAIVASFRAVGSLLVFGLLVAPPATAALVVRRVPAIMALGTGLGVLAVYAGLIVSYYLDTAASATMAGLAVGMFFVVLAGRELTGGWRLTSRVGESGASLS
jgi:ABC-type Mn2+/Zn2+ transport system permease subunit